MKVEVQLRGADNLLELLKSLPAEVVSKRGGPVKTGLRKGALVIQKQAKANLQAATSNATSKNKKLSTGLLSENLIVTRGKPPTDQKCERYLVRVKRKLYKRKGGVTSTSQTGRFLEYGTSEQPAEPWLRPAFQAKASEAINTTVTEVGKAIDRVVKKLSKK